MGKRDLMVILLTIVGVICILTGSIAYYRVTVDGSIKGTTGNAVFNVTGFTNEETKEIILKEGKLIPGDKGSFTLSLDATGSDVDMYVTLSIDKGSLPTNLKFYTTSDYKSELHKYYEFMDTSNQSKDITIYWYWNPYIGNEEDNNFINNNVSATIRLEAIQISEYAMMKNGYDESTEFWNYARYIRTIKFDNDLSNLPSSCTGDSDLCWDVSYSSTQNKKVYAYLLDSGLDYIDTNSVSHDLYNLYIVSEAPIFAPISCESLFSRFNRLEMIDFNNNFNTSKVTDMSSMFWLSESLNVVDVSNFNTSNVTDMNRMFGGCDLLMNLDVSNFNTSNVTDMSFMFSSCSSLASLDVSSFNTSNVTNIKNMFGYCSSLTNLDVSSFDTSKVINMNQMFTNCSSLTSLDVSSFNTQGVTIMEGMFLDCSSLTSLDLSNFNTSKVTSMNQMFRECSSLINLDVSNFNTSKVTSMNEMFYGCSSLTSLDLSSFNTSKVTSMYHMFNNCASLTTTINIMMASITSSGYAYMFENAATAEGAQITVNYIADASTLVDNMIKTKSTNSNVVKGVQI